MTKNSFVQHRLQHRCFPVKFAYCALCFPFRQYPNIELKSAMIKMVAVIAGAG